MPELVTSFRRRAAVHFNALVCIGIVGFCAFRLAEALTVERTPNSKIIYMFVVTVVYSIPLLALAVNGFSGEDIVHSLCLAIPFFQRFQGK